MEGASNPRGSWCPTCTAPCALILPAGDLLLQGLWGCCNHRGGRSGLGSSSSFPWPRDRLPLCPPFPSRGSPRPEARAPLRRASHCLTSHQATLGCAVPRSAPSSELIPLLGRKKELRDRKKTEVGVWASSRPRSLLGEGIPVAAPRRSGGQAGLRQRRGSSACSGIRRSKAVLVRGPLLRHCGSLRVAAW